VWRLTCSLNFPSLHTPGVPVVNLRVQGCSSKSFRVNTDSKSLQMVYIIFPASCSELVASASQCKMRVYAMSGYDYEKREHEKILFSNIPRFGKDRIKKA
jgi:hypothetical protein